MMKVGIRNQSSLFRIGILCLLLTGAGFLQGCLVVAWVATVGVDALRTSDLTFLPFEQSWVAPQRGTGGESDFKVTSVAILPFDGDAEMGTRLAEVLEQETALRIEVSNRSIADATPVTTANSDDSHRASLAKVVTRELRVDTVLLGRVAGSPPHSADWGWKEEEDRRLFLYLLDHDGRLLWKDELPFTLTRGSKPPLEATVQSSLAHHIRDHVQELGLDDLGYLPMKTS